MANFALFKDLMANPSSIRIKDYDYPLPNERIAKFPLATRDVSKLLTYKQGKIGASQFHSLDQHLPAKSVLVFNETRVIRARLLFRKKTGALIEIFCLEPMGAISDFQLAFQQQGEVGWKCMVGNAKRWKEESLERELTVDGQPLILRARKLEKLEDGFKIQFSWEPHTIVFSEIIEQSGLIPLPPYMNREAVAEDATRYQTVYARYDGSVAAPTAGLHFTDALFEKLGSRGIKTEKLTLHVGAGTFKPVSAEHIADHSMHTEKIVVSLDTLRNLHMLVPQPIIPVGTTSMRSLESLFWMALKLQNGDSGFSVDQWDPYQLNVPETFNAEKALSILITYLEKENLDNLKGETRLMIAPSYKFRLAKGLITNFHQPKSTLLLLVSAMLGDDWKEVYQYALDHDFRFLSYGDSCLFLPKNDDS